MAHLTERIRRGWQEFVGPEASAADTAVTLTLGALGAVLAPGPLARRRLGAPRAVALSALAADLWGGAWVNNTRACARWYERPGQTDTDHLRFAAAHLHPVAIAWIDAADRRPRWGWAAVHYGYLLAATVAIRRFRAHRQWLGPALTVGGVALDRTAGPPSAVRWFAPVYYAKLLLGHAAAARWSDAALEYPPARLH